MALPHQNRGIKLGKKHWSLGKCQEGRENGIQMVSGECGCVQGLMMLEENG